MDYFQSCTPGSDLLLAYAEYTRLEGGHFVGVQAFSIGSSLALIDFCTNRGSRTTSEISMAYMLPVIYSGTLVPALINILLGILWLPISERLKLD